MFTPPLLNMLKVRRVYLEDLATILTPIISVQLLQLRIATLAAAFEQGRRWAR